MRVIIILLLTSLVSFSIAVAGEKNAAAPLFSLVSSSGKSVALSDYRGKVVYLDFWASWCGPCKESLPWMNEVKREIKSDLFQIIAVNLDSERDSAERFLKEHDVGALTVAFDPSGGTAESYKVAAMPSSYIIDTHGNIVASHRGFHESSKQEIVKEVKALLAEQGIK